MLRSIQWGKHALGTVLPKGSFKEFLGNLLARYYDPLDNLVNEVSVLQDGSLLVELDKGVKFYALPDRVISNRINPFWPRRYQPGHGKEHMLAETLRSFRGFWYILREIYVDNIYHSHQVKKGDIVLDVGANIGIFTVQAAKAVGEEGAVIAIEPSTDNLRFLEKNVRENSLGNVVIVRKGVWSQKGKLKLSIKAEAGHDSLLNIDDGDKFEEVEVDTIDDILSGVGVKKVDFIKMDIEGAEIEAFRGMEEILRDNKVRLAIAAYHKVGGEPTYKTLVPLLKESGFQVNINTNTGMIYAMKQHTH